MKALIGIVLAVALAVGAFYALNTYIYEEKQADTSAYAFGDYAYRCEDGTEFTLSPSEDMTSIRIRPTTEEALIPETIISQSPSDEGVLYEGNGIRFFGQGETVTLSNGESTTVCRPLQSEDEAPLNWGD